MFLNRLNMKEKTAFLFMAHHIAHADGEFCSREQLVIDKYCMEMQVDDVEYSASEFNLADQLAAFEKDSHKKIALLELMALVFSDEVYHPAEKVVIRKGFANSLRLIGSYSEANPRGTDRG